MLHRIAKYSSERRSRTLQIADSLARVAQVVEKPVARGGWGDKRRDSERGEPDIDP